MWVRSQDKTLLIDCSIFKIEMFKILSRDSVEFKIAKKYKLKCREDSFNREYNFTKEQEKEIEEMYNSPTNEKYGILNATYDGDTLAIYSSKEKTMKVFEELQSTIEAINNKTEYDHVYSIYEFSEEKEGGKQNV